MILTEQCLIDSIKEAILLEYHHAYAGDNILDMVNQITNYIINNKKDIQNRLQKEQSFNIRLDNEINIEFNNAIQGTAYNPNTDTIIVSEDLLNNSFQSLSSLIYHELGHRTNYIKSNKNIGELNRDFNKPSFFNMQDEEQYKDILKTIYSFQTRELKARCFETTMFLNNTNHKIPLEQLYSERCTNIYNMKLFIEYIQNIINEGESSNDAYIIRDIYREMMRDKYAKVRIIKSYPYMCKYVLNYFTRQYHMFKKKIDKIYYDYVENRK
jgi:hypothetical protein